MAPPPVSAFELDPGEAPSSLSLSDASQAPRRVLKRLSSQEAVASYLAEHRAHTPALGTGEATQGDASPSPSNVEWPKSGPAHVAQRLMFSQEAVDTLMALSQSDSN